MTTTAQRLRRTLKGHDVISPDVPVQPEQALIFLRELGRTLRQGDVVCGISLGGCYAQLMRGWHRILINPSFHSSQMMRKLVGQRVPFHCERKDGATSFEVTDRMCKKMEELESRQFDPKFGVVAKWGDRPELVQAFFGVHDDHVDCKGEYLEHYSAYTDFDGGHHLDPDTTLALIIPAIRDIIG